jgi:hypothetical protein
MEVHLMEGSISQFYRSYRIYLPWDYTRHFSLVEVT